MAMETAAIYCRLSQDDGSVGESGSIQTQKTLLTQYCKEHHIKVGTVTVMTDGAEPTSTVQISSG